MCRKTTTRILLGTLAVLPAFAQTGPRLEWHRLGSTVVENALASVSTGPVSRAWYSSDGSRLFALTESGHVFETDDFERWKPVAGALPAQAAESLASSLPEAGARIRSRSGSSNRLYSFGRQVWRSEDGGLNWTNLTGYKGSSVVGEGIRDLTVSPRDEDELVVGNGHGLWRSIDGGLSWTGLNQGLPNLPVRRILSVPNGSQGMTVALADGREVVWWPGEKSAWQASRGSALEAELALRLSLSRSFNTQMTAVVAAGESIYAGTADGHLWASTDRGVSWRSQLLSEPGPIEALYADPREPRVALAAVGGHSSDNGTRPAHVLRTINGGLFWDDLTSDLPDVAAHGITADRASGAVYVATDRGVYFTLGDLNAAGPPTPWTLATADLDSPAATDVKLGSGGNQLYVALDGYGIYTATAPHRLRDPRLVNAADFSSRAAAPGSLLTVLGEKVQTARIGNLTAPVLAATETDSQIQVPFEARGSSLSVALEASAGRLTTLPVALQSAAPAIFVDRDGTPMLLDGASGILLDATAPAQSNGRIQILATGLGRVMPEWPTGLAAPLENPPKVVAGIRAFLNGTLLEVTRATLAPGYVGFYLIEVQVPRIVDAGPAELYVEADGQVSNRVRVYLEP